MASKQRQEENNVSVFRQRLFMSKKAFAEACGVSKATIYRAEDGIGIGTNSKKKILKFLKIPFDKAHQVFPNHVQG